MTRVVDGDTIDVNIDGTVYRVRYIGIDTPESTTQAEPLAHEVTEANRTLVEGKEVLLYKDVSETDRYDRLLRYVVIPGEPPVFVNYELVRRGYVNPAAYPPDVACADTFVEAQRLAREEGLGLWAPAAASTLAPPMEPSQPPPAHTAVPATEPTSPPAQPTVAPENCDPSYPDVCIPPAPPDLDCKDIPYRRFKVLPPDPHGFDSDNDGIGCESK